MVLLRRVCVCMGIVLAVSGSAFAASPAAGVIKVTNMNVICDNVQAEAALGYLLGFLGGDMGRLFKYEIFPVPTREMLSFIWSRQVAYPYTKWRWENSVIKKVSAEGGKVRVEARLPSLRAAGDCKDMPKAAAEWKMFAMARRGSDKGVVFEDVVREIHVDSGKLKITVPQLEEMARRNDGEMIESLQWVRKNWNLCGDFRDYLMDVRAQNDASTTVKLAPHVAVALEETLNDRR